MGGRPAPLFCSELIHSYVSNNLQEQFVCAVGIVRARNEVYSLKTGKVTWCSFKTHSAKTVAAFW